MRATPPTTRRVALLCAALGLSACTPGSVQTRTTYVPAGAPVVFASDHAHEDEPDYEVQWALLGERELVVSVTALARCHTVEHRPVLRTTTTVRKPRGRPTVLAVFGAGLAAVAVLSFARPEVWTGTRYVNTVTSEVVIDPSSGYAMGGLFSVLSAGALAGAIGLWVGARDSMTVDRGYQRARGPEVACALPPRPASGCALQVLLPEREVDAITDDEGHARVDLGAGLAEEIPRGSDGTRGIGLRVAERAPARLLWSTAQAGDEGGGDDLPSAAGTLRIAAPPREGDAPAEGP